MRQARRVTLFQRQLTQVMSERSRQEPSNSPFPLFDEPQGCSKSTWTAPCQCGGWRMIFPLKSTAPAAPGPGYKMIQSFIPRDKRRRASSRAQVDPAEVGKAGDKCIFPEGFSHEHCQTCFVHIGVCWTHRRIRSKS